MINLDQKLPRTDLNLFRDAARSSVIGQRARRLPLRRCHGVNFIRHRRCALGFRSSFPVEERAAFLCEPQYDQENHSDILQGDVGDVWRAFAQVFAWEHKENKQVSCSRFL